LEIPGELFPDKSQTVERRNGCSAKAIPDNSTHQKKNRIIPLSDGKYNRFIHRSRWSDLAIISEFYYVTIFGGPA